MESIEQYLVTQRATYELWSEDDTLILNHLLAVVEVAHRKGYSEALLQDLLKELYAR